MTDIQPTLETVTPSKSPLESRTVQVAAAALITAVVGHFNPAAGDWLKAHQEYILSAFAMATTWGRSGADKPLNWRDWSFNGIGIKF